ncbi:hypothetical protein BOO69_05695 [Sulfitobacter alexandrii]|uniref:Enterobactin synthase component D n=1 Tax=Sulfitobacter alexandrii TaxID=1917485 RepID=A0A1J0WF78_9RHOB|nr:4'-phosphopantetheinyl transferase superfamily protein [Sulfitobacter alexandrii]APE42972.1 hypothetical protein BOO69_05695 [Sulfitobacter alexandrii]
MPDRAALQRAVRGLFDGPVAVGLSDPSMPQPGLFPEEEAALAGMVPDRRREFAAGRAAARLALAEAGHAAQPIPMQDNRAPLWPPGVAGSITHTRRLCIAVVSDRVRALGLDAEEDHPMDEEMISTICSEMEISRSGSIPEQRFATMIFSAKEAVYKAQFALTGALFGFEVLDVTLEPDAGRFAARFLQPVGPFAVGDSLPGRIAEVAGHLVTGVAIGQRPGKGA